MNASEEIVINSRTKISLVYGLHQIFKESFRCLPFVFKKVTLNFASIWLPLAILCLVSFNILVPNSSETSIGVHVKQYMILSLHLIEHCFIIFIVPYYVYVFLNEKESSSYDNFRDFLSENMFPLVVNHMKTTLTVILYFLLLIIPGVIKTLQLTFVTHATFFDKDYKSGQISSALKASQQTTKGFLFGILLLIIFVVTLSLILTPFYNHLTLSFSQEIIPLNLIDISKFIITFYINCFTLLLMTQAYFVLKKFNK